MTEQYHSRVSRKLLSYSQFNRRILVAPRYHRVSSFLVRSSKSISAIYAKADACKRMNANFI